MLEISDLHISYGRAEVVRGISLSVNEGEIVAVIGPNGAGKSTTLAGVCGLRKHLSGAIALDGGSLRGLSPDDIVRKGVALVPEGRRIFMTMTVEENMRLGATPRRDREQVAAAMRREFERFPILKKYAGLSAAGLSGGEQQQLAIARALLARPKLLLLDEPSLGLAPQVIQLVFETLRTLRDEGTTILLVEQDVGSAVALADRTYVLSSGRVRFHGTREEVQEHGDIASTYFGLEEGVL